MKTTDYGKKVGQALKAVAKMHSQVSQLLSDCDGLFPDYQSVFGNTVTGGLTYHVKARFWMAEGVFRYWFKEGQPLLGITAMFHPWEGDLEQPLLVVGYIDYSDITSQNVKERCDGWSLWYAVMDWSPKPLGHGEVIELSEPDGMGAIQSMKLIAVPLFQIESLDDVTSLFKRLGVESTE